ncbi:PspA/IM30 family protein [Tumebacillus sp. ITR2]|uniref:PspA/IM30 family protein n=1 Tax=Tumebacillus amylolyticus TaxID=2801339 RepID=A0ABS1J7P4_9BACL|nr:PspA/IM30 family protein [Tumebacillus amylolyticus]MBL0385678.1 PspA/IM30 family protein [Tumebacillus amylolyticus]
MIFKRIRDLVVSSVHEGLDKLENPVALIKQYLRDVEFEITKAERTIAHQVLLEQRQAALVSDTKALIAKRARQAQLAVETGDEEIAKVALQEKIVLESKLTTYESQLETIATQTETLNNQLRDLQEKYADMQAKKRLLIARSQAAQTSYDLNCTLNSIDADSAVRGFARMEERVLLMEATAEAGNRVRATHLQLAKYATDTALQNKVEEELAKLKASQEA